MKISLCVVAYNEKQYLPALLQDILGQSYPKEKLEILLIDGGSTDGTRQQMEQFAKDYKDRYSDVLVLDNPGKIQSCGWNTALVHFTGDVIVRVDAHGRIPEDFVQRNAENLQAGEMVSGGARPVVCDKEDGWSNTLLLAEESLFGSSISSFRRKGEKGYVNSLFHGAYRREVFETVGGFREDLGRTEDNEIHYRIRKAGYRLCMSPDIHSFQYIRPTLRKMCGQKFGNGYWIGLTSGVCPGCLSLYHFVPGAFIGGILLTSIAALLGLRQPALILWGAYWLLAVLMAVCSARKKKKSIFLLLLPVLFFLLHISYGAGTWLGLIKMPFWRRRHRTCPSVQQVKEQMKHGRKTA